MFTQSFQSYVKIVALALLLAGCSEQQPETTAANSTPSENDATASVSAPASTTSAAGSQTAARVPGTTAAGHSGVIEGQVTDAAGQPVAGAFVKLDNAERRLTFMVISQDGGSFMADRLPSGNYVAQGVGGDYQSSWSAPVSVSNGAATAVNLTLNEQRSPDLPPAWPRRMPEHLATPDTLPDGPGKDILMKNCSGCHSPNQVIASRYNADTWASTVEDMAGMIKDSGLPVMTEEETRVLLEYVVTNMPEMTPPDPNSRFPRQLMQGEARKYRSVQYNLEQTHVETHDVAVDPWGIGWANQRTGGMISRFDPESYEYSEIGPPLYTAKRARPGNLQISADGIMWLADPFEKRWLSYDIANNKWTDWPFPVDKIRGQVQGNSVVLHHDGTIWMAGPGSARRLNPATGEWSAWDTPTWLATRKNPGGYGITVAGDGRVWMAMNLVDKMARFDGNTGEVAEFDLEPGSYPRRMDYDNNGNVYVGLWGSGKVLKIDHKTDEMSLISPPIPNAGPYSIDYDKSTNLMWVTLQKADIIARHNLETREWLMLPLPQAESDVRRIEVDQKNPKRVWWVTNSHNARIGFVELLE